MPKTREDFVKQVQAVLDEAASTEKETGEEGFYSDVCELVASECEERLDVLASDEIEDDDDNLVEEEDEE